jgi:hypothetical protein
MWGVGVDVTLVVAALIGAAVCLISTKANLSSEVESQCLPLCEPQLTSFPPLQATDSLVVLPDVLPPSQPLPPGVPPPIVTTGGQTPHPATSP